MPLFGGLHKTKSKESLEHDEHGKPSNESQGLILKHLVHRTSNTSVKDDQPTTVTQQSDGEGHRNSAEPHLLSQRSPSMSSKHSHHSTKTPPQQDHVNIGNSVSAAQPDAQPSISTGTLIRAAPNSPSYAYDGSTEDNGLTKEDVHRLFSGAPHFTLEKGSRGRSFPQVFFPWDKNLEIGDLVGRRWLEHESFALATLHAHLPVPDKLEWQPTSSVNRHVAFKRPAFELGIFEVPNMLGVHGKEPGTVGMRHFLELPIADRFRAEKPHATGTSAPNSGIASLPSAEAFKALQHSDGSATVGKHAPCQDRVNLIQNGPQAWRRIGVREIDMQTLTDRLARISSWHEEVVSAGFKVTVLDKQDTKTLYNELFTKFLFPPQKVTNELDQQSMKVQIEALLKVLTTPGAWVDISLVASRLHLGQMLWESIPHEGEDVGSSQPGPGMERRWLLVQLLLSIELVIRLDAALRLGLSQHSAEINISGYEIHHFNKLRNTKLDWDLVFARRFLDYFCVTQAPLNASSTNTPTEDRGRRSMLSRFKHKSGEHGPENNQSACDCLILPRRAKIQLDGLLRFANFLNWPNFHDFERRMLERLEKHCSAAPASTEHIYGSPIHCPSDMVKQLQAWNTPSTVDGDSKQVRERHTVWLQAAGATQPGGWLSRSWLTALVLPGEAACDLLISTLLENEPEVLTKLGAIALLHGGFVLDGRSWWSKSCVVGRVFAPYEGGTQCMGWISTPKLLLVNEHRGPLPSQWMDIEALETPCLREKTRIHDGVKMAVESSPLGRGQGKVMGEEFVVPGKSMRNSVDPTTVNLDHVALRKVSRAKTDFQDVQTATDKTFTASAQFTLKGHNNGTPLRIIHNLTYDVYFVTAHPCQLPRGVAAYKSAGVNQHLTQEHEERLLSHPLHETYKYVIKSITDLPNAIPPNHSKLTEPAWVVDARGSVYKDIFVRAWCSQVGRHALVSRIGKSCLSCSIREARAIEVGIIIRVGVYD